MKVVAFKSKLLNKWICQLVILFSFELPVKAATQYDVSIDSMQVCQI